MEESTIAKQNKNVPLLPWMRSPVDVSKFEEYPLDILPCLDPRLKMALQNMGFKTLFPVQIAVWQETIGPGAFERDLCINSPTGSGKTLAYALPIVQMLSTRAVKCLRALVVLPTRDLALQVKQVFAAIAPAMGLSVGLAVGQSSIADEISELIKKPEHEAGICYDPQDVLQELQSSVDILVATPGRLMDHITTTKGFTLEHLCYLVVDETDRLLRESYQSWLPTVLKLTSPYDESLVPGVNNFLPYASGSLKTIRRCPYISIMSLHIFLAKRVSCEITDAASWRIIVMLELMLNVIVGVNGAPPASYEMMYNIFKIIHVTIICVSKLKPLYLVAVLQHLGGEKCIVFTSSVESTHRLCTLLNFFGDLKVKIKEYSGLQRQSVRSKTLKAFREGQIQVLVSSDAMTRGMDIEGVRNIINYDMPAYVKTYVHRAGRTARAGQTGRCITLLRTHEVKRFKKLLQKADNDSCPIYSIPSSSVKSLHPFYLSAKILDSHDDLGTVFIVSSLLTITFGKEEAVKMICDE
ncbi:hypothetical protein H0E87_008288 [Populus deltoides]|uniref:ATP-dependent RNA helicase n=1 Tax=Populus deltoides TaxID=3696 RepID=A0A8T2Z005_POPDE|nr:hypothetical protein H0E87_008288 [Populus deltoides]